MRTPRTLVVEDNRINLEVLLRLLGNLGHRVDAARSGEEALRTFSPGKYQLVLMDCHMPGLDGFQTTTAIRNHEQVAHTERVCIIAVTADTAADCRERCLSTGMDDYLSKPISFEAFRLAVERGLPPAYRIDTDEDTVFDPVVLEELGTLEAAPGEPKPLEAILDVFLSETPVLLNRFNLAVRRQDRAAVLSLGRLLQASCTNLGARRAIRLCSDIQLQVAAAPGLLSLLNKEFSTLFTRLRHIRENTAFPASRIR